LKTHHQLPSKIQVLLSKNQTTTQNAANDFNLSHLGLKSWFDETMPFGKKKKL
jgi:hypothetical protein